MKKKLTFSIINLFTQFIVSNIHNYFLTKILKMSKNFRIIFDNFTYFVKKKIEF